MAKRLAHGEGCDYVHDRSWAFFDRFPIFLKEIGYLETLNLDGEGYARRMITIAELLLTYQGKVYGFKLIYVFDVLRPYVVAARMVWIQESENPHLVELVGQARCVLLFLLPRPFDARRQSPTRACPQPNPCYLSTRPAQLPIHHRILHCLSRPAAPSNPQPL